MTKTMDDKRIAQEYADDPRAPGKKVFVSTVKLIIDHGYNGKPLWFETYIFQADDEGTEVANWSEERGTRYETRDEAIAGHETVMAQLRSGTWPE